MSEVRSYNRPIGRNEARWSVIIAFGLLFVVMVIGVTGFMLIEEMNFTQAFYMTIITIATVGFQEVHPLSVSGMWFTSFLIVISFGIFVYAVTSMSRYIIDGVIGNYYRDRKARKRVKKLDNHVIICGYGRNGSQAVIDLKMRKVPYIVIENNPEIVESLRDIEDILYIEGDATQDEILHNAGISDARALITTLPVDADNLYVVLTAKEINPSLTIISRASNEKSNRRLKRAGASNVIMPDRVGGQQMAKLVTQPDIVEFLDYMMLQEPGSVFMEELSLDTLAKCFEGKEIKELRIRNKTGANIIGLRRPDRSYIINPGSNVKLSCSDQLFVLGTVDQISTMKKLLATEQ
ncbi:potassium channel family protein [Bacteroidota bacterium]